jgi:hypothetical protein
MKATRATVAKTRRRRVGAKDLAATRSAGVKGGIVIDWAAAKPGPPGEDRGVIAIIKPVGGV